MGRGRQPVVGGACQHPAGLGLQHQLVVLVQVGVGAGRGARVTATRSSVSTVPVAHMVQAVVETGQGAGQAGRPADSAEDRRTWNLLDEMFSQF